MKNTAWFWSTWYYKKNPKVYDLKFIVKCIYFSFFFFPFFFFFSQTHFSLDVFSMSHERASLEDAGSCFLGDSSSHKGDPHRERSSTTASWRARWLQRAAATSESPPCPPYLTGSLVHGAAGLIALKKGGKQVPLFWLAFTGFSKSWNIFLLFSFMSMRQRNLLPGKKKKKGVHAF